MKLMAAVAAIPLVAAAAVGVEVAFLQTPVMLIFIPTFAAAAAVLAGACEIVERRESRTFVSKR